jgi:hypothetical protein
MRLSDSELNEALHDLVKLVTQLKQVEKKLEGIREKLLLSIKEDDEEESKR